MRGSGKGPKFDRGLGVGGGEFKGLALRGRWWCFRLGHAFRAKSIKEGRLKSEEGFRV